MAKICLNPECKKEFIPKSSKALYCSPACKSRHQYLEKKKALEPAQKEPPKPIRDPTRPWIEEIEQYCLRTGVYPDQLIDFHRQVSSSETGRLLMQLKKSLNSK
jgi:hypothetical protein